MANEVTIEVCYALADRQYSYQIRVPAGSTIGEAIRQSGLLEDCPRMVLEQSRVGVYGEFRELDDEVNEGDRIEIYHPLKADPKETRRRRASREE